MIDMPQDYRQSAILPPRALLLALLCQVPLLAAAWPPRPGPIPLVAGTMLLSAGMLLNILAARCFHRRAVGVCPFSSTPALIKEGPFRFSRNPMYLGLVALSTGFTLVTGVLANLWISVAYFIWLHHAYVMPEERFLRRQFGAAYERYAQRVPRWLVVTPTSPAP
jgi:protein-S-isoprenylcysteine O-methyltransferase Ste14